MEIESDLEGFIIEEKRHRELINTINNVVKEIPETNLDLSSLEEIKNSLNDILNKEENNFSDVNLVESINKLSLKVEENINSLKDLIKEQSKPKEYSFDIERSKANNFIKKVNVIVK
jgi:hypothetical protein